MGRPATGSARWNATRSAWEARVTLADGRRVVVAIPDVPLGDPERARRIAGMLSRRARETGSVPLGTGETMNEWAERWHADRVRRGFASTRDDRSHFALHIAPTLGTTPIATVSRVDVEALVQALDRKVQEGAITWKTALNCYATASKMLDDAAHSKTRELRARNDNPAEGVRGPDRGAARAKQFLYPSELLRFVSSDVVPLTWRRVVVLAVYLYPRDGELRALRWDDVDLEHGTVHIHKSWDRRARKVGTTKTGGTRRFSIEGALLPLLAAMHEATGGQGAVHPLPSERDMSRGLRRWLRNAGVTRAELHDDTPTTRAITFHDLRATGITWCAIRGDDPLKIMQRAGHSDFATTQRYIREAENVRAGFGDVFPPLPPALATPPGVSASYRYPTRTRVANPFISDGSWRGGRDSNPRPPA